MGRGAGSGVGSGVEGIGNCAFDKNDLTKSNLKKNKTNRNGEQLAGTSRSLQRKEFTNTAGVGFQDGFS